MEVSVPHTELQVNAPEKLPHQAISEIYGIYKEKLRIDVEKSFQIGDKFIAGRMWENNAKEYIERRYGAHTYKAWVGYCWIARRWNAEQRKPHTGKPWTWFRNNNPAGPNEPQAQKPPVLHDVVASDRVNGELHIMVKIGTREVWARIPSELEKREA